MVLQDRIAIVTGAARGIGKSIALALAGEGAHVVVADINSEGVANTARELTALGRVALPVVMDVAKSEDVARMVEAAVQRFGRIDILVNDAAVVNNVPVLELTEATWNRILAINLTGVFLCCQKTAEVMIPQQSGRLINISSLAGHFGAPGMAAYTASKHGVIGLTKVLAIELGQYGITANAVCPGNTDTEMVRAVFEARAAARNQTTEQVRSEITAKTPMRRFGLPEDVAQMVVFLSSPAAAYVTGQAINVCGGRSINLS